MRYLRAKHIRKSLRLFQTICGIKPPYKVLIDGNFLAMCLQMNVDVLERVPKFLRTQDCTFFIPRAAVRELELLGEDMAEASKITKLFTILNDRVKEKAEDSSPVSDEIMAIVGESNMGKYIVATQEVELRSSLRSIPGVPLIYLNRSVLVFEDISKATLNHSKKVARKSVLSTGEKRKLDSLDVDNTYERIRARRGNAPAKGPNPLSCKKKSTKKVRNKRKKTNNST